MGLLLGALALAGGCASSAQLKQLGGPGDAAGQYARFGIVPAERVDPSDAPEGYREGYAFIVGSKTAKKRLSEVAKPGKRLHVFAQGIWVTQEPSLDLWGPGGPVDTDSASTKRITGRLLEFSVSDSSVVRRVGWHDDRREAVLEVRKSGRVLIKAKVAFPSPHGGAETVEGWTHLTIP